MEKFSLAAQFSDADAEYNRQKNDKKGRHDRHLKKITSSSSCLSSGEEKPETKEIFCSSEGKEDLYPSLDDEDEQEIPLQAIKGENFIFLTNRSDDLVYFFEISNFYELTSNITRIKLYRMVEYCFNFINIIILYKIYNFSFLMRYFCSYCILVFLQENFTYNNYELIVSLIIKQIYYR